MQLRAGGGVLHVDRIVGPEQGGCAVGGQGGFVKAAQDELLFAGVGVDVAHRKNAWLGGGKGGGVHHQLAALHGQAPVGDGPELGRQPQQHQQRVQRQRLCAAVGAAHL